MGKKPNFHNCVLCAIAFLVAFVFSDIGHAATVVRVDFQAQDFFDYNGSETPPESSLTGSFVFEHPEVTNYTGVVDSTLTSINLEIAGHTYSLSEVGLDLVILSNGAVSDFTIGGLLNGIVNVSSSTNDFEVITTYGGTLPDRMWYATESTTTLFKSENVNFQSTVVPKAEPVPDIKANNSDGPVDLNHGNALSVTIELDPGDYLGYPADWWCVADTPFGWYYYNGNTKQWLPGFIVSYQGPLFNLTPPSEVLNVSDLYTGGYTFYFGVDGWRNGRLDEAYLYYDSVEVTITP